ncbi:putative helicase [Bacillus phage CP-51]|uniref:Putative helicase n=1 Tax=Bacillus phage CP-51 TaxID=1391188 RepID=A0A068EU29_9CAUD|nr:DNA helicase [Bacillus phage CP-51]AID50481.1 putative helicase [Bacillus phage CP-51]
MAVIEIGNLHSTVIDASAKGLKLVDTTLSVETPGCQFTPLYRNGTWDGMTRFFSMKTKKFPSGLLSKVVWALEKTGETVEIVDKRKAIDVSLPDEIQLIDTKIGHITLRDYQYDAVKSAIKATRGIVNVATNGGKTEIAAGIIKHVLPSLKSDQRVLFFTHSKEIFSQSHKRLEERLGMKVGRVGTGVWDVQQVNVVMIPTVSKYLNPKKIPKNMNKEKYLDTCKATAELLKSCYCFLGDEAHHSSSDTWYKLFMKLTNAYFRFGLTGTVDESNQINVKRLLGCTGRIVIKISNDFLIQQGFSAKPTIYMLEVDTDVIEDETYSDSRKMGIISNVDRNTVLADKVSERVDFGKQCLIIVNETEHGDIVSELLEQYEIDHRFVHGDRTTKFRESALEDFKNEEFPVMIATSILDEGVDISGINCLFLAAGGKSMRQLLQRIGRGLRKKADGSGIEVYDFLDYHNEYLAEHTLDRYETYKNEAFHIVKLG